jgi:hypothetical protein
MESSRARFEMAGLIIGLVGGAVMVYSMYQIQGFGLDPAYSISNATDRNICVVWFHGKRLWFTKSDLENWELQWNLLYIGSAIAITGGCIRQFLGKKVTR